MAEANWDDVTYIRKSKPKSGTLKTQQALNSAQRQGVAIDTEKKWYLIVYNSLYYKKINEKPQVINEYESGKAIPNNIIMSKLERNLGIRLRGKDRGKPFGGPKQ
ncbi:endothelial differentiation-related factor 1 homolog [Ruditapes philippinarum]|uniref:endothelial differentiation-related factor 1 homolog n=1 Tax=Ruditapes philippinarum TaxID=129788 RepID=UPI00295ACF38|nr:endothelial differentiation-related factor 1 homolog [Ruditapes philippinarum]